MSHVIGAAAMALLQITPAGPPSAVANYNWCVYIWAEMRMSNPDKVATKDEFACSADEAMARCQRGPLLDNAVTQFLDTTQGSPTSRGAVADLLRMEVRRNAIGRLYLIYPEVNGQDAQD